MATLGWILVLIVGAGLLLALPRFTAKAMSRVSAGGSARQNTTAGTSSSSTDPDPEPDSDADRGSSGEGRDDGGGSSS